MSIPSASRDGHRRDTYIVKSHRDGEFARDARNAVSGVPGSCGGGGWWWVCDCVRVRLLCAYVYARARACVRASVSVSVSVSVAVCGCVLYVGSACPVSLAQLENSSREARVEAAARDSGTSAWCNAPRALPKSGDGETCTCGDARAAMSRLLALLQRRLLR